MHMLQEMWIAGRLSGRDSLCDKNRALRFLLRRAYRYRLLIFFLLVLLGAGWRLAALQIVGKQPPSQLSGEAVNIGRSIANGRGFANAFGPDSGPTAHTTPLYPLLLGALFRLFEESAEGWLVWVSGGCVAGAGGIVFLLAWRFGFGILTALLCALMAAFITINPFVELHGGFENQMAGCLFALYSGVIFGLIRAREASWRNWVGVGAAGGAVMLGSAVLAGPVVFSWLYAWWSLRIRSCCRRYVILAPIAALAVVSPWAIRNYFVIGWPVLLRSNFGLELAISNHDLAGPTEMSQKESGAYIKWHPFRGDAERKRYSQLGEIRYMEQRYREAIDWISRNPIRFVKLSVARVFCFFFRTGPRTMAFVVLVVVTILGFAGMVTDLRANPSRLLFYGGLLCAYSSVYSVVQVSPRYRIPVNWIVLLYGAHFIRVMLRGWSRRRRK